ncbi:MAG: tRNA (N(6)-L-threonylcarbamoyladenosine(37)-C(2))-methylthiotransferase MtaB [Dehalococcoidales bacterium]|nr:tRNA (N(6)-L-threonylcarbamoyladenosine(37)-C(2))-methylthiotransferase MtaB [Dehalococcoidales bacterium]
MSKGTRTIRAAFDTLGCKLNQAEAESLSEKFVQAGYQVVAPDDEFDVYILNTCTVTHIADRKARHLLRMAHRRNPGAVLVAAGCYAEHAASDLIKIDGVRLAVGNHEKMSLPQLLIESGLVSSDGLVVTAGGVGANLRTRSFISIQDGCNNFCSYCIVPYVRGREKSVSPGMIIKEISEKVSCGYREVVLTGTEIGSYNYDGLTLESLIDIILKETTVERLRLSSLQPQEITPGLIALWKNGRLCSHFHMSLQSGSDTVLKRMRRLYTTADYLGAVSLIRSVAGEAAITTDIIAGFPGESDQEFSEGHDFCKQIGFARIHVFSYSKRRGTAASIMPDQISPQVKKKRSDIMLKLAEDSAAAFHSNYIGKNLRVLWEQADNGIWSGYSANYIKVYTESDSDLTNVISNVSVERLYGDGVWGEIKL